MLTIRTIARFVVAGLIAAFIFNPSSPARADNAASTAPAGLVGVFHGFWSPWGLECEFRIFGVSPNHRVAAEYLVGKMSSPYGQRISAELHDRTFSWSADFGRGKEEFSFTLTADGGLQGTHKWGSSSDTITMTKTGASAWPWIQDQLGAGDSAKDFESTSPIKAVLPASATITPPAASVPPAIARLSGVWNGWMCYNNTTDLKVAFTSVAVDDAVAIVAWGWQKGRGATIEKLKRAGETEFVELPWYRFRLRADGVLDIMHVTNDGSFCFGVLHKAGAAAHASGQQGDQQAAIAPPPRDASPAGSPPDVPWPATQDSFGTGDPAVVFTPLSVTAAKLPAGIKITTPDATVPSAVARLSGVWSGWICPNRASDLKVAVTSVTVAGAEAVIAITTRAGSTLVRNQTLKMQGDEFRFENPAILYKYRFHPGLENVLDVMFVQPTGFWCSGVLHKDGG